MYTFVTVSHNTTVLDLSVPHVGPGSCRICRAPFPGQRLNAASGDQAWR